MQFATITIDVNDVNDAPTNISLDNNSVDENELAGALVGLFSATDADAGETFFYTLVSGEGDDDNASFSIVDNELKSAEVFDFETKSSYSIRVRVTDGNELCFEKVFEILVADLTE